jgi:hypothetical protein
MQTGNLTACVAEHKFPWNCKGRLAKSPAWIVSASRQEAGGWGGIGGQEEIYPEEGCALCSVWKPGWEVPSFHRL